MSHEAMLLKGLLAAAMRACDHHNDDQAAREAMRADCIAMPSRLHADLRDYFTQTYGPTHE